MAIPSLPSYELRLSRRARRVFIRIDADGNVRVTLPHRVREEVAHDFVMSRRQWIEKTVKKQKEKAAKKRKIRWVRDEQVPFLGRTLTIAITEGNKRRTAFLHDDILHLSCKESSEAKSIGEWWYREQARDFFEKQVKNITAVLGVRYGRISIKQQSTLWGSCSKRGNLNFNWRLMLMPEEIAQSIAVHECAHLIHLNHSKKFWALVASISPDYKKHNAWLKEHGMSVM